MKSMIGGMTLLDFAIVVWIAVVPLLLARVLNREIGKVREKFNELPAHDIPKSSIYLPFIKTFAIGIFSFSLIIGISYLPF